MNQSMQNPPDIVGVIPARYASSRFPGKPLADILGTSMIMRVVNQVRKTSLISQVIVATDDQRIFDHVQAQGIAVMMTSQDHASGTDRMGEVAAAVPGDFFINIQGDEPLIDPAQIDQVAEMLLSGAGIATLAFQQKEPERISSSNVVKVVISEEGEALYFSRSVIPHNAHETSEGIWQHIGIYGFGRQILTELVALPPHPLEQQERLEQLRWLANGYRIMVGKSGKPAHGVDSPEDLEAIIRQLR